MPQNYPAAASLHQDVVAERILPVVQIALDAAARAYPNVPPPPTNIEPMVELALFTSLVAISAVSHGASKVGQPRLSTDELHQIAADMTPTVEKDLWDAATKIAASDHMAYAGLDKVRPVKTEASHLAPQSRLLARTEATRIAAESSLQVGHHLGLGYKVWISRGDPKVRTEHRRLHGKAVPLDKPFITWPDGEHLSYPGDMSAPMSSWINCRCVMFLVEKPDHVAPALEPANLDSAFALAASLEQEWFDGIVA